jgi:hypothetical protein
MATRINFSMSDAFAAGARPNSLIFQGFSQTQFFFGSSVLDGDSATNVRGHDQQMAERSVR